MTYFLYTDGAARGNPGPGGAGVFLKREDGTEVLRLGQYLGVVTNNQAEYRALLLGLQAAMEKKIERLRIFADSELLVRQVNGEYKVKNEGLKKIYPQVMELLTHFEYSISHIPRDKNEIADELANEAIDEHIEII